MPGGIALPDRGFDVSDTVALMDASLDLPAFAKGQEQLSAIEIENTRKIAAVRIHIERVIGAVRQNFSFLPVTGVISKRLCYIAHYAACEKRLN